MPSIDKKMPNLPFSTKVGGKLRIEKKMILKNNSTLPIAPYTEIRTVSYYQS